MKIDGFFRAGIKGRLITRRKFYKFVFFTVLCVHLLYKNSLKKVIFLACSDATQEKIKKAILENDALALMQSANYNHRYSLFFLLFIKNYN